LIVTPFIYHYPSKPLAADGRLAVNLIIRISQKRYYDIKETMGKENGNSDGRIEALREREKAIRAQIAQATAERLRRIVGEAALAYVGKDAGFAALLKDALASTVTADGELKLLRERGLL
jgi:hypothetical protein